MFGCFPKARRWSWRHCPRHRFTNQRGTGFRHIVRIRFRACPSAFYIPLWKQLDAFSAFFGESGNPRSCPFPTPEKEEQVSLASLAAGCLSAPGRSDYSTLPHCWNELISHELEILRLAFHQSHKHENTKGDIFISISDSLPDSARTTRTTLTAPGLALKKF